MQLAQDDLAALHGTVSSTITALDALGSAVDLQSLKIGEITSTTVALSDSVNALNLALDETKTLLVGLTNRVNNLESLSSSTLASIFELNNKLSAYSSSTGTSSPDALVLPGGLSDLIGSSLAIENTTTLKGDLEVNGRLSLGVDTVGQAKILSGTTTARVIFSKPFAYLPIVAVTPLQYVDGQYWVGESATSGFSVQLQKVQAQDALFNWQAFVSNQSSTIFVSDGTTSTVNYLVVNLPPMAPVEVVPENQAPVVESPTSTESTPTPPDTSPVVMADNPPVPPAEEPAVPPAEPVAPPTEPTP